MVRGPDTLAVCDGDTMRFSRSVNTVPRYWTTPSNLDVKIAAALPIPAYIVSDAPYCTARLVVGSAHTFCEAPSRLAPASAGVNGRLSATRRHHLGARAHCAFSRRPHLPPASTPAKFLPGSSVT
ncbi:hypothetical protein RhiJN_23324 [Ceratobasidium sp. AG-Ba]|nr:hypothetical protein RhiJN_23324 [Ceratobasidium sp. AG-Ba]